MPPLNTFTRSCLALAIGQAVAAPSQAATITVNTAVDVNGGGPCTLREAILSLQNVGTGATGCNYTGIFGVDDTVEFEPGLIGQTITLSQTSPLSINTDLTISGLGQNSLTIDGDGSGGVFEINNNALATLTDLTISGGNAVRGGGVLLQPSSGLNLYNSAVSLNTASNGGGIFAFSGSSVKLTESTVSGNYAISSSGGIGASEASIELFNSNVLGNSAVESGGGIFTYNNASAVLTNSSVSNNLANSGGGIRVRDSNLSLAVSTVSGNSASSIGGGVFANRSSIGLSNSTVSGNTASDDGGGIFALDSSSVSLINSTVSGNLASDDGGGVHARASSSVSLTNSTVSGNSAFSGGGGIFADFSTVNLNNSTISNNVASGYGGGISTMGGSGIFDRSIVSLTNSTVSGNSAGDRGGGIRIDKTRIYMYNNIVAGNFDSGSAAEMGGTASSSLSSSQHNLFGDSSNSNASAFTFPFPGPSQGAITATSNGTLPTPLTSIINPLASNGGKTTTHALPRGSPAINNGDNGLCPAKDQRGESRSDGECDIGAYEHVGESCFVVKAVNDKTVVFCL